MTDAKWQTEKGEKEGEETSTDTGHMLAGEDITWVDLEGAGGNDYTEFLLMSRCKHHILANSSFSWWGAWLSLGQPGTGKKMVIAPLNGITGRITGIFIPEI